MPLTLTEISDRIEITETITLYSVGLDQRQWELWDRTFTPDAVLDFTPVGLSVQTIAEARATFDANEARIPAGQHLLTNTIIELDGDTATARSEYILNTFERVDTPGRARWNRGGGWYDDDLVRTEDGWRISRRTAHVKWHHAEEIDWPTPGD